jgi:hypothetical protein
MPDATQEEIGQMYLLATETMTLIRLARDDNTSDDERLDLLTQWYRSLSEIETVERLHLFMWCSISLGVACVDGLLEALEHVPAQVAEHTMDLLEVEPEIAEHVLKLQPKLSDLITFEGLMQNTVMVISENDAGDLEK